MRKLLTILLVTILFINIGGYQLWSYLIQSNSDISLIKSLDHNNYNDEELIRLTIPLNNAYQSDWSDFKRVDGEISLNGISYRYVKEKVENGSLVLLCLPDHNKMKLESARTDLLKSTFDITSNTSKKQSHSKLGMKNTINEFIQTNDQVVMNSNCYHAKATIYLSPFICSSSFQLSPEQPPEIIS